MTTYREIIYMCLDLLKGDSDDYSFNENHVAYLVDKARAMLLYQKYGKDPKKHIPYSNYQTIKVKLDTSLKSVDEIPYLMDLGITRISTADSKPEYHNVDFNYVSRERLPFVGNNRFLKNMIYCGFTSDNRLQVVLPPNLKQNKLETVSITGIFENPKEVFKDYMDCQLPIEEEMIPNLIEIVVKELAGPSWSPKDSTNNASDDLSSLAQFLARNMKSDFQKKLNE